MSGLAIRASHELIHIILTANPKNSIIMYFTRWTNSGTTKLSHLPRAAQQGASQTSKNLICTCMYVCMLMHLK
jgi:hypothetical protein